MGKANDREHAADSETTANPAETPRARRRHFSAAYKLRIVEAADRCTAPGEIGALLRREGLYDSHLSLWRKQYHAGGLKALEDNKRGRKPRYSEVDKELEKLRRENARLESRIKQAEAIIDIQKKVAAMEGIPLKNIEDEKDS